MDVTLGVSVDATSARIALLDAVPPHAVIDQSEIDLTAQTPQSLASTLISTNRSLLESGHRLVATRLCSSSPELAGEIHAALVAADLADVAIVQPQDAVTAVIREMAGGEITASLTEVDDTAALSIVDADSVTTSLIAVEPFVNGDRALAYRTLLERFGEEPAGATSVILVTAPEAADWTADLSAASPVPLRIPDSPGFVLARGAAIASVAAGAVSPWDQAATVMSPAGPQLAYSEIDEYAEDALLGGDMPIQTPMSPLSGVDPDEIVEDGAAVAARPRALLVGSTVAAVVVVGFAALAVSVAINIRPTVTQQAIRTQDEAISGRYFPVAPGQGTVPDGENWTVIENLPEPGTEPVARQFVAKPLSAIRAANYQPQVFDVYRDGTVGLQSAQLPLAPGQPAPLGVPGDIPDFVPRLIPDLSQLNMCQVLGFLSNMQRITTAATNGAATAGETLLTPLTSLISPMSNRTLGQIGVLTAVPAGQNEIFETPVNTMLTGGEAIANVPTIPGEIFKTSSTGTTELVPNLLPPSVQVIDALPTGPTDGLPDGAPVLSGGVPSITGLVPDKTVKTPVTVSLPEGIDVSKSVPVEASVPNVDLPSGTVPAIDGVPAVKPNVPADLPKVDGAPLPLPGGPNIDGSIPKVDDVPIIKLPEPVKPPVSLPEPVKPPVSLPEPQAPVVVPDIPVVTAPEPPVSAPSAPGFQIPFFPDLKIPSAPAVPAAPAPVPEISVPDIAVPAAPSAPSGEVPSLSDLPILGGLFGG